jgi:hypothetical protein
MAGDAGSTFGNAAMLDIIVETSLDGSRFALFPLEDDSTMSEDAFFFNTVGYCVIRAAGGTEAVRFESELDVVAKLSFEIVVMDCT